MGVTYRALPLQWRGATRASDPVAQFILCFNFPVRIRNDMDGMV